MPLQVLLPRKALVTAATVIHTLNLLAAAGASGLFRRTVVKYNLLDTGLVFDEYVSHFVVFLLALLCLSLCQVLGEVLALHGCGIHSLPQVPALLLAWKSCVIASLLRVLRMVTVGLNLYLLSLCLRLCLGLSLCLGLALSLLSTVTRLPPSFQLHMVHSSILSLRVILGALEDHLSPSILGCRG